MVNFPTSLVDFQRRFPDEDACATWLFAARWPTGFRCPGCAGRESWPHGGKRFTYECASCGKQTSVTAGTILHGSKLPLTVWFWASYLMSTHSNGISALQLQKQLALGSYKTAWLLAAKLRRAMTAPDRGRLAGIVEIDETTLPLRGKDEPLTGGGGRSSPGAKCSAPARLRSMETARGAFVSERSRTCPPRRCMVSSPPMWRKVRRSRQTDRAAYPGAHQRRSRSSCRRRHGRSCTCCHGSTACLLEFEDLGARRLLHGLRDKHRRELSRRIRLPLQPSVARVTPP